jgi:DNA replication regulator DPB11
MFDHRLPVFSGVRLCITGMEDIALRNKVHVWLEREGGVYLKSLNATATHLLCCVPDTSAKLKWTRDYNRTRSQTGRIRIVWEEWFWDCIEFGGA